MKYGSICSGVAPQTKAWGTLGLDCVWFAEIEPFPSAVLAHHFPEIPNLGDFTRINEQHGPIDLLVGGTPCQSFSVAGKRAGLDDARGNLTIEFVRLAQRLRPRWLVWENVPGVLSIDGGRTFGTFLGMLGQLGYGFAYRILDAQYFGVAQRRRRVFVVGCLGNWRLAAAVLFERESLSGNPAPSREKGKESADGIRDGVAGSIGAHRTGGWGNDLDNHGAFIPVAHSPRGEGLDASEDGTGRAIPLVPEVVGTLSDGAHMGGGLNGQDAYSGRIIPAYSIQSVNMVRERKQNGIGISDDDVMYTMTGRDQHAVAAFGWNKSASQTMRIGDTTDSLQASITSNPATLQNMAVRRLTPRECERLQGMPDDYTLIPYRGKLAADGPRYKAIGNSWAVPVLEWIGTRIVEVAND